MYKKKTMKTLSILLTVALTISPMDVFAAEAVPTEPISEQEIPAENASIENTSIEDISVADVSVQVVSDLDAQAVEAEENLDVELNEDSVACLNIQDGVLVGLNSGEEVPENLVIPKSVTSIKSNAFKGSTALKNITFADGSKLTTIGSDAFYNSSLETIVLPESLTRIDGNAFKKTKLKEIVLPKNVSYLANECFAEISSLRKVKVTGTGKIATYGAEYPPFYKDTLEEVLLPEGLTEIPALFLDGVTYNGENPIVIPKSVTVIGSKAFKDCSGIGNKITFAEGSRLTTIGSDAFYNSSLEAIVLPESLTKIEGNAFKKSKLKEIVLPKNVSYLANECFAEISSLRKVKVTGTGKIATYGAEYPPFDEDTLEEVLFPEGLTEIPALFLDGVTYTGENPIVIPKSVTVIGSKAFKDCSGIGNKITFEDGSKLTTIGADAFYNSSLETIVLPESLTKIDGHAFEKTKLEEIVLPKNVSKLGASCFAEISSLRKVKVTGTGKIETYGAEYPPFDEDTLEEVLLPEGLTEIPALFLDGVTYTGENPIVIPKSVTVIGSKAFKDCSGIGNKITFEDGSKLTTIGADAFYNSSLETIVLPESLTKIDGHAFEKTKLEEIVLPKNVSYLGANCFAEISTLRKVVIEANGDIATYGAVYPAFEDDTLETVTIAKGMKTIPNHLFYGVTFSDLTIVIPDSVKTIKSKAFMRDGGSGSIVIPSSVKVIENDAFDLAAGNQIKLVVTKKSYAEKWMKDKGIPYSVENKIQYYLNGGQNASNNPMTYKSGDVITLSAPTRNGYEFVGWYKDSKFKTPFENGTTVTGTFKVYAKWNPITYSITYVDVESTENSKNPASYSAKKTVKFAKPKRAGYTFLGWYTDSELTNKITSTKNLYGELTLYAAWRGPYYTVSFKSNGGKGKVKSMICEIGKDYELNENAFSRKGYTFQGWSTTKKGSVVYTDKQSIRDLSTKPKSKVTLYAVWAK